MNNQHKKQMKTILSIIISMIFLQCAALQEFAKLQKPKLNIEKVRVTAINLKKLDLMFDVNIDNPNPLSANLVGFDYDLNLGGESFLSGQQEKKLVIEANSKSQIHFPVSFFFENIYKRYQSLKNLDSTSYKLMCGLMFDLPILGKTRIPVTKSGNIPLIKIPTIKVNSLKLKKLKLSGADLLLNLELINPNNFSFALNEFNYNLNINNKNWAKGHSLNKMNINKKGKSTLSVPVTLNFKQIGRTVYKLIASSKKLNYDLNGRINLDNSIPMLKNIDLPINKTGEINLLK